MLSREIGAKAFKRGVLLLLVNVVAVTVAVAVHVGLGWKNIVRGEVVSPQVEVNGGEVYG